MENFHEFSRYEKTLGPWFKQLKHDLVFLPSVFGCLSPAIERLGLLHMLMVGCDVMMSFRQNRDWETLTTT